MSLRNGDGKKDSAGQFSGIRLPISRVFGHQGSKSDLLSPRADLERRPPPAPPPEGL